MADVKTELSTIIPRELALNLDFWTQLNNNLLLGHLYVPTIFITYIHKKYGYSFEVLDSSYCREYIIKIALQLQKSIQINPNTLLSYTNQSSEYTMKSIPNQMYSMPKITYVKPKETKKSRIELINNTPIAIFD